nr:hypothetical protein CFP56_49217 [Quercus suber]
MWGAVGLALKTFSPGPWSFSVTLQQPNLPYGTIIPLYQPKGLWSITPKPDKDHFIPNTPIPQESKVSTNFTNSRSIKVDCVPADIVRNDDDYSYLNCKTCQVADEPHNIASNNDTIGNFPSPTELANLDEGFLASRCNLGYRGSRIWKLARDIVEGRIQLTQLEEASKGANFSKSSNYDKLAKQLKEIDGFGTFTYDNVLMCMGYYHVIPTDSETIQHLRKVHARYSTVQMVQRDIECVYGKYAPFQFLAYWGQNSGTSMKRRLGS